MINKFIHTESGYNHQNEDFISVVKHNIDSEIIIGSLADGQGGQSGGGSAAKLAVTKSIELIANTNIDELIKEYKWIQICKTVDQYVSDDKDAGYTTLINLAVIDNKVYGASSGDSAALLINNNEQCVLTENQYKNPPVGSTGARFAYFSYELKPHWEILIMSDGVWKYIGWDYIFKISKQLSGSELITGLRDYLLQSHNGHMMDDFSIIIFQDHV
jgi:PPM family protein phosphatase